MKGVDIFQEQHTGSSLLPWLLPKQRVLLIRNQRALPSKWLSQAGRSWNSHCDAWTMGSGHRQCVEVVEL